jgi:uncharacterized membrane protein
MSRINRFKWPLAVILLHLAAMAWFFAVLPGDAKVPTHWNIHNQIDNWTNKAGGILFGIGLNVFLFLLFYLMPWYSPWYRRNRERFEGLLPRLCLMLVIFASVLTIYALSMAKWPALGVLSINLILVLIGFLFIFLGNILPKVPKNFFIGIRTPWTLANETIWDRTHRLGGYLYVLGGLIMLIKGFVLPGNQVFQISTAVIALALFLYPLLHSFIVYRRLRRE